MKFILLLSITVLSLNTIAQETGTFTDSRDGKTYKTVKIGNQTWFSENLNYNTGNSLCYKNNSSNCIKYGRLYDWQTAKNVCPTGWHLPSENEFKALLINLGGSGSNAYHALKDGGKSGFSALLGGWGSSDASFYGIGSYEYWWSSSETGSNSTWTLLMSSRYQDYNAVLDNFSKEAWLYVRCIKD